MLRQLSAGIILLGTCLPQASSADIIEASLRPLARGENIQEDIALTPTRPPKKGTDAGLTAWIVEFRARALELGITAQVFDTALNGVTYDEKVIQRDRNQSEFTKTIWDYLDTAVSDLRIANGRKALAKWGGTLDKIEGQYGVDKEVVVAIWGLESAYGTFRGSDGVINSLATLAYDARRADFFEEELINALRILQSGDTTADRMTGSWAGAMGHTQFMPSSFNKLAVDHDGDGKRNIWGDDPTDALASTAAYLKHFGWKLNQPWGVEVRIPEGFDYLLADRSVTKLPSDWAVLGVTDVNGTSVKDYGLASVLLPGGAEGAAFLIFSNFEVIEHYNTADAYVVGIGHLSDRIKGKEPFKHGWPVGDRALTYDERVELQERLTAAGFDTEKIDAKMGPLTVSAVRRFQNAKGIVPDGYPSLRLLERLRAL
ncbi:MAG: lytic murein transglycosylase [Sulfitobacter sp.]